MRIFLISIWLPVAIVLFSFIRIFMAGGDVDPRLVSEFFTVQSIGYLFIIGWPSGMFLTYPLVKLIHRNRVAAFITGVLLAPVTVWGALIGGLFGPLGIVIFAMVASLPAWIVWSIVYFQQTRRSESKEVSRR